MATRQAASATLQRAVSDYFAGERCEMTIAIAAFVAVAALAIWRFIAVRTGFAMAFVTTLVWVGAVMAAGLAMLMIRDHASSRRLSSSLMTEHNVTVIVRETARIRVVLSKFKFYRLVSAGLASVALTGLMLSDREWIQGAAAGLLTIVASQLIIDHFSERRARAYLEKLTNGR